MAYALIKNNIVIQVDKSGNQPKGFIEAPDYIVCGQIKRGDNYVDPEVQIDPEQIDRQCQAALVAEADPLFFKWQAGEVDKEVWLNKRKEIFQIYKPKE